MRALIVEDDAANRRLMQLMLTRRGHEAVACGGAAEAFLAAVFGPPFDVVLLDRRLPDLDGLAASRRLRALPGTQGAFILLVTAYPADGLQELAAVAGCDAVLIKPFDSRSLFSSFALKAGATGVEPRRA